MTLMVNHLIGFGVGHADRPALQFVGATAVEGENLTIAWPSGTQAGDLAILIVRTNNSTATITWPGAAADLDDIAFAGILLGNARSKTLTSTDISTPPSYFGSSAGAYYVAVYRGNAALTYRAGIFSQTGTTATVPGFTPAAATNHLIGIVVERDTIGAIDPPSGWVENHQAVTTFSSWATAQVSIGLYAGGSLTWTNFASANQQNVMIYEVS